MLIRSLSSALLIVALVLGGCRPDDAPEPAADVLVHIGTFAPSVVEEIRYAGPYNFVGGTVDGYEAQKCLLTQPAAEALAAVQADLEPFGLGLKVFDCYRPQRAVDRFVRWAEALGDTAKKALYYPDVPKDSLFALGYIAARSGHSRGSTVDLTLVPLGSTADANPPEGCDAAADIDMGTGYDCFGERSHTAAASAQPQQRANRLLLRALMEQHGFVNYSKEWWHFRLRDEPFPDHYFDVPIR
jgi:D-alanyl-D-alanine dipeptidase